MDATKFRLEIETLIKGIQDHIENTQEFEAIPSLELKLIVNKIEKLHQTAIIYQYLSDHPAQEHSFSGNVSIAPPREVETFKEPAAEPVQTDKIHTPTAEIRKWIGINDKFLLTNRLFHGNSAHYEQALDSLNHAGNVTNAIALLNDLSARFNWSADEDLKEYLTNLVHQLFSV